MSDNQPKQSQTTDPLNDVPKVARWVEGSSSVVIAVAAEPGMCGWYDEPCQSPDYCIGSCLRLARHEAAKSAQAGPLDYGKYGKSP